MHPTPSIFRRLEAATATCSASMTVSRLAVTHGPGDQPRRGEINHGGQSHSSPVRM